MRSEMQEVLESSESQRHPDQKYRDSEVMVGHSLCAIIGTEPTLTYTFEPVVFRSGQRATVWLSLSLLCRGRHLTRPHEGRNPDDDEDDLDPKQRYEGSIAKEILREGRGGGAV